MEKKRNTREELEKIFGYKEVERLVKTDVNYSSIENIVTFRTEKGGREVNEYVEWIREYIIGDIIEKQKKGEKVRTIMGHAVDLIKKRIGDKIESDRQERKYKERLENRQIGYNIPKERTQRYKTVINKPLIIANDIRLKQIVNNCLNNLEEEYRDILIKSFYKKRTRGEIAEESGIEKKAEISTIKHKALGKLGKAMKQMLGTDFRDVRDRLYDVSMWPQIIEQHPEIFQKPPEEVVESTPPLAIHNPELSEETKKYMDMLLHSLYEVAKIMPISDMMDEYLCERLKGKQKKFFENHLMECDKCYEDFKERRNILSALLPVLDDIGEWER